MSAEQTYIKNIENGIRAIKLGNKKPNEVEINSQLERLKAVNIGMYDELNTKYVNVVSDYNKRNQK